MVAVADRHDVAGRGERPQVAVLEGLQAALLCEHGDAGAGARGEGVEPRARPGVGEEERGAGGEVQGVRVVEAEGGQEITCLEGHECEARAAGARRRGEQEAAVAADGAEARAGGEGDLAEAPEVGAVEGGGTLLEDDELTGAREAGDLEPRTERAVLAAEPARAAAGDEPGLVLAHDEQRSAVGAELHAQAAAVVVVVVVVAQADDVGGEAAREVAEGDHVAAPEGGDAGAVG